MAEGQVFAVKVGKEAVAAACFGILTFISVNFLNKNHVFKKLILITTQKTVAK